MILVVGATGVLGGAIARELLRQGREVRILVRRDSLSEQLAESGRATSARSLIEAGAVPVEGDLKDPDSLREAVRGIDTIVTTANSAVRGGDDNPQTVELEGNRHLIDAAAEAGVEHFVFVSVLGADPDSPAPFVRGKAESERRLRGSGMSYTILAPNVFMEVWVPMVVGQAAMAGRPVVLMGEGRRRHAFVSMRDVTAYAVTVVDHPQARNRRIDIGGPEALSWRDIVAEVEKSLGRELAIETVAPGQPVPGVPAAVLPLMASFETYDSPLDMGETARTFGIRPTPLSEVVDSLFAPD